MDLAIPSTVLTPQEVSRTDACLYEDTAGDIENRDGGCKIPLFC